VSISKKRVVIAHRHADLLCEYAKTARERGIGVIIAGAGGAAHLPGMVASMTPLPVVGVPVKSRALNGLVLAAVDRADARGRSRGHDGHQRGEERRADRRVDPRFAGCRSGGETRRLPRQTDRGCAEG